MKSASAFGYLVLMVALVGAWVIFRTSEDPESGGYNELSPKSVVACDLTEFAYKNNRVHVVGTRSEILANAEAGNNKTIIERARELHQMSISTADPENQVIRNKADQLVDTCVTFGWKNRQNR